MGSQTPEGSCGVRLSQLRSLWAASPSRASCCSLQSSRHFVVATQTRSLAGVAVCSLGPFQGAAVKMPGEGKGLIVLLTCLCLNNAACKNIISIYTACLQTWPNYPISYKFQYLTPLNRELWDAVGRDVLPQGGSPTPVLLLADPPSSWACWKCKAGVCCASLSARRRRMLVQNSLENAPSSLPALGSTGSVPGRELRRVQSMVLFCLWPSRVRTTHLHPPWRIPRPH